MDSVDYTFRFRELYLADQLKPEEKQAFEEELGRNPQLLEALKEQIYLGNMLGEYLGEEEASSSNKTELPPKDIRQAALVEADQPGVLRRIFAQPVNMAAAIAFFLVCAWGVWWIMAGNQGLGEQLYAENYTHLSERETSRTRKGVNDEVEKFNGLDSLLHGALLVYSADDFPNAIKQLSSYINTGKDTLNKGVFYRGLASLKVGDSEAAIKDLQNYLQSSDTPEYKSDATWYIALAYLKEERIPEALTQLKELSKLDGPYKIRSGNILKSLPD